MENTDIKTDNIQQQFTTVYVIKKDTKEIVKTIKNVKEIEMELVADWEHDIIRHNIIRREKKLKLNVYI